VAVAAPLDEFAARGRDLLGQAGEELVDFDLVLQLAGARDGDSRGVAPAQLGAFESERLRDDVGAGFVEHPVEGGAALTPLPRRPEAIEHAQRVELAEASARGARSVEVQAAELLGGEHAVLEAVERDLPIALGQPRGERDRIGLGHLPWTITTFHPSCPTCRATDAKADRRVLHGLWRALVPPFSIGGYSGAQDGPHRR
jgi:hypothetical protein